MDKTTTPPAKTETTKPEELANKPATPATPDPRAEFQATLKKFTEKFGAASGAQWAADGLSFEAALEKHAEQLASQLKTKDEELAKAQQKLAAVPRGEPEALSSTPAEKHPAGGGTQAPPAKFAQLGKLAKFAAGIKLPAEAK